MDVPWLAVSDSWSLDFPTVVGRCLELWALSSLIYLGECVCMHAWVLACMCVYACVFGCTHVCVCSWELNLGFCMCETSVLLWDTFPALLFVRVFYHSTGSKTTIITIWRAQYYSIRALYSNARRDSTERLLSARKGSLSKDHCCIYITVLCNSKSRSDLQREWKIKPLYFLK